MFVGIHTMLAMQTKTPELMISEQEGKDFMKAAQNVMKHYSVQSTQKTLDWVAFLGVAGGIYGTRIFAVSVRKSAERAADTAERGQVLQWPVTPKPRPTPERAEPAEAAAAPYVPSVIPADPGSEDTGF
jgi:hypothetical protein